MLQQKVLGIIPARGGSKGILHKNTACLAGTPLINYTINAAKRCTALARCIVSTDSTHVAEVATSAGGDVPFLRSVFTSQDCSPSVHLVQETLHKLYCSDKEQYDAVCLLQPTSPFRTHSDITAAIELFSISNATSLTSVCMITEPHPNKAKIIDERGNLKSYIANADSETPRQALPAAYFLNGAIYLTRTTWLARNNKLLSDECVPYEMPFERSLNIDTKHDLVLAEALLNKHNYKG